jgi:hypothetical protein
MLVSVCKRGHVRFISTILHTSATAVAQSLMYCVTNQKVAGSIGNGVMEFFIDINPSDRTMTLGSTQPLTEVSTRGTSWRVNAAGA